MRIIAGNKKGMRLYAPEGRTIRPTPSIVRESLFNIIGQGLDGVRFLDLYAGTGAIGLEAVSRGAGKVVLVDRDSEAVRLCRMNALKMGEMAKVEIIQMDVIRALRFLAWRREKFDFIFCGPPFKEKEGVVKELISTVVENGILDDNGWMIFQLSCRGRVECGFEKMEVVKQRRYGRNKLVILSKMG